MAVMSASLRFRLGIRLPGLTAWGFLSQRLRLFPSGSLGSVLAAMLLREPKWVGSGPTVPCAGVPRTVWQVMQAPLAKRVAPCCTSEGAAPGAGVGTAVLPKPWMRRSLVAQLWKLL